MRKKNISLHTQFGPDAVPVLSGMILDTVEKQHQVQDRFMTKRGPAGHCVIIYDSVTGTSTTVSLCNLLGFRQALEFVGPMLQPAI